MCVIVPSLTNAASVAQALKINHAKATLRFEFSRGQAHPVHVLVRLVALHKSGWNCGVCRGVLEDAHRERRVAKEQEEVCGCCCGGLRPTELSSGLQGGGRGWHGFC